MRASNLFTKAMECIYRNIRGSNLPFEEWFEREKRRLLELEVTETRISGRIVLSEINEKEVLKLLELDVESDGYWLYYEVGFDGDFIIENYRNRKEVEDKYKELRDDLYVPVLFIIE